jgi:DNA-binding transcriptional LysR family regulator
MQKYHPLDSEQLQLLQCVAQAGSMAAAARQLGLVPSALSYRIRQIEEGLDVLLFDRSSRQARLTEAGQELVRSGAHLLEAMDALAQRVRRIATGWEPMLTIAADAMVSETTLLELVQAFDTLGAPTRLRLRTETLSGTLDALLSGQADLAIGIQPEAQQTVGIEHQRLGEVEFVFVVAPSHPLAKAKAPLSAQTIQPHRIVAVADSTQRGRAISVGVLPGQEVLTVSTMRQKLQAQRMGLGCGWLPLPMVQPLLDTGQLVSKTTRLPPRRYLPSYAWRTPSGQAPLGKALSWWIGQLKLPRTQHALLHNYMNGHLHKPGV